MKFMVLKLCLGHWTRVLAHARHSFAVEGCCVLDANLIPVWAMLGAPAGALLKAPPCCAIMIMASGALGVSCRWKQLHQALPVMQSLPACLQRCLQLPTSFRRACTHPKGPEKCFQDHASAVTFSH